MKAAVYKQVKTYTRASHKQHELWQDPDSLWFSTSDLCGKSCELYL